jgi:TP901 family phage tail tape measure protein
MSDMGVVASATGVLRLDASGVDRGVDQAGNALNRLTGVTNSSYFGLRNLALGFEAVGDAAAAVVGGSAAAAIQWESGMARINTSTFQSSDAIKTHAADVSALNQQFQSLAANTPVPIKGIQQVGNEVAKLGVGYRDVAADTKVILDLNQTTGASFETLTNGVGKGTLALGLGADGVQRFGATLFGLQAGTPATTEDILTLTQRIAGVGAASHISQPEILGMSAAIASTGGNVRTNASAVARFIETIQTSVTTGGASLDEFARLAGVTSKQFTDAWAKDPGQALSSVIRGLGDLNAVQGQGQSVLQALGFTQATQIDSLLNIARSQVVAGDSALAMSNSISHANELWQQGTALQQAAGTIYNTTSAAIQDLRNNVDLAGVSFGSFFLPIIKLAAGFMSDFAAGVAATPAPIRDTVGIMLSLVAVVGTVGGAMLFLLPKFIQARQALIQMAEAHLAEAGAAGESATANVAMAESTQMMIGLTQELLATQLVLIGEYETLPEAMAAVQASMAGYVTEAEIATVVNEEEAASMGVLAAAGTLLSEALSPITLVTLAIMGVMTAAGIGIAAYGAHVKDTANKTLDLAESDQSLVSSLQGTTEEVTKNTNAWILNKLAQSGALELMQRLGFSAQESIQFVQGTLDPKKVKDFADTLQNTAASGAEWASKMATDLQGILGTYEKSVLTSRSMATANQQLGVSADEAGASIDGLSGKTETLAQKEEKAQQAGSQYAQALLGQASAAQGVQRARDQLTQATSDLANKSLLLAEAEGRIALSSDQSAKALVDLADAQFDLDHAREDAARKVEDAQLSLQQADLAHRRSIQGVADAQERLNKLMDPKDNANKLRDAYRELRDAQEALHKGQQTVEDAQWQINYLMTEGASKRDLQDAQDALSDAQNKVADSADKASDAQAKINDLQNQAGIANQLADAQLALEGAQLEVEQTTNRLADAQEAVNKAQLDAANDKAFIDAQVAVQQAHNQTTTAALEQSRALDALHKIQNGSIEREFRDAQLQLETAMYQQAAAIVEVQRQHDTMHGKLWTSRDYTQALGRELVAMGNAAGGPVGTDLANMGRQVQGAGTQMGGLHDTTKNTADTTALLGKNVGDTAADLDAANPHIKAHEGFWRNLWDAVKIGGSLDKKTWSAIKQISSAVVDALPFAAGGIVTSPTISLVGEAGPEMILPLNDLVRSREIIEQANMQGLFANSSAGYTAPPIAGVGSSVSTVVSTEVHHDYGDFTPTIISNADPDDMMREWEFRNQRITRQPVGVK